MGYGEMFIGVHLVWSELSPTELAVIDSSGTLLELASVTTDAEILDWVNDHAGDSCVVAVDAPLIIRHQAGTRACEQALELVFHQFHPAAFPLNSHIPSFAGGNRAQRLVNALRLDPTPGSTSARRAIEVYPEPSVIPIFDLVEPIRTRRGSSAQRRASLEQLMSHLEGLQKHEVPLLTKDCVDWAGLRYANETATDPEDLDLVAGWVDATVCAYVALYAERMPEHTYLFGDPNTGAIITPISRTAKDALDRDEVDGRKAAADPTTSTATDVLPTPTSQPEPTRLTQQQAGTSARRMDDEQVVATFAQLPRYDASGRRAPHVALLVLTALGHLNREHTSSMPFSSAQQVLARLIKRYGPPLPESPLQTAATAFTELGHEDVWLLDAGVSDTKQTLLGMDVSGRFAPEIETALRRSTRLQARIARLLVDLNFPSSLATDVLLDAGLDPDTVGRSGDITRAVPAQRRPSPAWASEVIARWDHRCAFCGYDGRLGTSTIGLEAAPVRWFIHGGPDDLDNSLALCSLHRRLLDAGALGIDEDHRVKVSLEFSGTARSALDVRLLHGYYLEPPEGTPIPAESYVAWHDHEVFKG